MQNSLLYYRHNSESDSYLNTDKFPRNRDHNTASKGPPRYFRDVVAVGFKLSEVAAKAWDSSFT